MCNSLSVTDWKERTFWASSLWCPLCVCRSIKSECLLRGLSLSSSFGSCGPDWTTAKHTHIQSRSQAACWSLLWHSEAEGMEDFLDFLSPCQNQTIPQPEKFCRLWESFRIAIPYHLFLTLHSSLGTHWWVLICEVRYLTSDFLFFILLWYSLYIYTLMDLDDCQKSWKLVFLCFHCVDTAAKHCYISSRG